MADFGMTMKVKSAEYRHCVVGGRKALFHRWVESDKVILEQLVLRKKDSLDDAMDVFNNFGIVSPGMTTKVIKSFYGLVEYEDGAMEKVDPEKIKFKDSDYMFESVGAAWND